MRNPSIQELGHADNISHIGPYHPFPMKAAIKKRIDRALADPSQCSNFPFIAVSCSIAGLLA